MPSGLLPLSGIFRYSRSIRIKNSRTNALSCSISNVWYSCFMRYSSVFLCRFNCSAALATLPRIRNTPGLCVKLLRLILPMLFFQPAKHPCRSSCAFLYRHTAQQILHSARMLFQILNRSSLSCFSVRTLPSYRLEISSKFLHGLLTAAFQTSSASISCSSLSRRFCISGDSPPPSRIHIIRILDSKYIPPAVQPHSSRSDSG